MKLFQFTMLLLVQLSPIFVHIKCETVSNGDDYKCVAPQTSDVTVTSPGAKLTNGCVVGATGKRIGITFDLKAMYDAAAKKTPSTPKTPVVIDITQASFTDSFIKLSMSNPISDATSGPLLFTMIKTNMSGGSKLEFGLTGKTLKLPPNSRIHISESKLAISYTETNNYFIFTLISLQLVSNSSMEISHNVITMECNQCYITAIFYVSSNNVMMISDKSSFILRDNAITIKGHDRGGMWQSLWFQTKCSPLTISQNSQYTWASNIISMVGYDVTGVIVQFLWFQSCPGTIKENIPSALTISDNSKYTWIKNNISIVGHNSNGLRQYVLYETSSSPLTISQNSQYMWTSNIMSMVGYDVKNELKQFVMYLCHTSPLTVSQTSIFTWESNTISMVGYNVNKLLKQYLRYQGSSSPLTISQNSQYTWASNIISMVGYDVTGVILQFVWYHVTNYNTISDNSRMVWKDNCIGLGHKEGTDKSYVFAGKWSITGDKSELLLDGNNITTTDKYVNSSAGLVTLMWGPAGYTVMEVTTAKLTIRNTKVYTNDAAEGATGSTVWDSVSSSFTSKDSMKPSDMKWSSSPAKDGNGSPIPTLDSSNLQQYMCGTPKTTDKVKSATAILSTIPAVLITSVVFLYFNW